MMGLIFIYISYLMLTDIPPKESLLWLHSADVKEIEYLEESGEVIRINLSTASWCCLSVKNTKEGFASLLTAVRANEAFSIGYNKERELFSDSPRRYTVIYEIIANGSVVKSYENHVRTLKFIFLGVGLLGLFMLGSAVYYGVCGFPPGR